MVLSFGEVGSSQASAEVIQEEVIQIFTSDLKAKGRKRVLGRGNSRCKDLAAREHGWRAEMEVGKRRNRVLGRGWTF